MDNQSRQSTASFKGKVTSLMKKIFRREAEATGLDDSGTLQEISLLRLFPYLQNPNLRRPREVEQDLDLPGPHEFIQVEQDLDLPRPREVEQDLDLPGPYMEVEQDLDLPGPFMEFEQDLDLPGPREFIEVERDLDLPDEVLEEDEAYPDPPHAPLDPWERHAIKPWEHTAFPNLPPPPFDSSEPQATRPSEENGVWRPAPGVNPRYIYKAALTGDWEMVERLFQQHRYLAEAVISSRLETPLHVAVATENANHFVGKLLSLLPDKALEHGDFARETALHYAARVGNVEAAAMLVNRKPNLLYITNKYDRLPVQIAAMHGQKEMLSYLIGMSSPGENNNPFEWDLGVRLLMAVTTSGFFDVALDLVRGFPHLASSTTAGADNSALSALAQMSSAFPHGESFSFWHNFICCSKSIGAKKVMHQQALELVHSLCHSIASLPYDTASAICEKAIIRAAKEGNHQVVRVILEYFPTSIFAEDPQTGRGIFALAIAGRHENVFNLIYDMSDRKLNYHDTSDILGNNFMHLSAMIAPSHKLNLVPGPALQMQRELQWFKEVEKFVHPSRREWLNRQDLTPRMLFSQQHHELKSKGQDWMRDTATSCSVAAALVATIVFAAAFTLPGGLDQNTGIPLYRDKFPFLLFVFSDAVSLFTALTSLLMFLSILTSRYAEHDFLYVLPSRSSIGLLALFVSVTFMMAAFGAAMYLMLVEKYARLLIAIAALACLPVASFVFLQFPLLIAVVSATYCPGIFGKKTGKLLYK